MQKKVKPKDPSPPEGLINVAEKYNLTGPKLNQEQIDKIVEKYNKKKKTRH